MRRKADVGRAGDLTRRTPSRASPPLADWLAVAVAVSLPWSTSATAILVVLWLLAALPALDRSAVRRTLASADLSRRQGA